MKKEVDNIIPFPKSAEPVNEEIHATPLYVAEEEDEETNVTIDFENQKIYSLEETWVFRDAETKEEIKVEDIKEPVITGNEITNGTITVANVGQDSAVTAGFQSELQEIFMNSLISKAVSSLLQKHSDLDRELDKTLDSQRRMGDMGVLIQDGVHKVMEERRAELRACYNGSLVRPEKIPDWAKTYVRDYIRRGVQSLDLLVDI